VTGRLRESEPLKTGRIDHPERLGDSSRSSRNSKDQNADDLAQDSHRPTECLGIQTVLPGFYFAGLTARKDHDEKQKYDPDVRRKARVTKGSPAPLAW
jgi:hypothetical protein